MSTPEPTPRPWTAQGQTVPAGEFWAVEGANAETIAESTSEADAALIVRAVNAHDDLVAALQTIRDMPADPESNLATPRRMRKIAADWLESIGL